MRDIVPYGILALMLALGCESEVDDPPTDAQPEADGRPSDDAATPNADAAVDAATPEVDASRPDLDAVPELDASPPAPDATLECPMDFEAADGQPCAQDGQSCSAGCVDRCQFCNILRCEGGRWSRLEVFPDPNCGADAAVPVDAAVLADAAPSADAEPICPADLFAALGTACAVEDTFCGGEQCGPCGFCNLIRCTGGVWERLEAPPPPPDDPACQPDAGP
jgi:hypothetical protein